MFAAYAIVVFCLASVSHSAPLACEDLLQSLDPLDPVGLTGRWALVAGSLCDPAHLEILRNRNSSGIHFSNSSATSSILYTHTAHVGGKCHVLTHNVSLDGSILTFDMQHQVNLTVTFLYTSCQDCLVMRFDSKSKALLRLLLFSRRREVEQQEMGEFRAQVECLKMPPPVVMDPTKELCPEQTDSAAAQIEEKQH